MINGFLIQLNDSNSRIINNNIIEYPQEHIFRAIKHYLIHQQTLIYNEYNASNSNNLNKKKLNPRSIESLSTMFLNFSNSILAV